MEAMQTNRQPVNQKSGRRKAIKGMPSVDKGEILRLAEIEGKTGKEIATLVDCNESYVSRILKQHSITPDEISSYKKNESDLLTALRVRIYKSFTDDDIKSASFLQRMTALGIAVDKQRLIDGESTSNQAILVHAISDLRQRDKLRNGEHSGLSTGKGTIVDGQSGKAE